MQKEIALSKKCLYSCLHFGYSVKGSDNFLIHTTLLNVILCIPLELQPNHWKKRCYK